MKNPFSSLGAKVCERFSAVRSTYRWQGIGVVAVLAIVALFFVLSGVGQSRVSVFASVELDNPVFASSNDRGTIIVDSDKTRLVFVNSNNELLRIVQVDQGEMPISEVSHVQLVDDGVFVVGSQRSEDGETIESESVLYFDYDGTYIHSMWDAKYVEDDTKESGKGKEKDKEKDKKKTGEASAKRAHFEPSVLDVRPRRQGSSDLSGLLLTRTTGDTRAGVGIEIDEVSLKEGNPLETGVVGNPSLSLDEFVRDARYLTDSQRLVILGDWGSVYVADASLAGDNANGSGGAGGYTLHTASNQERYAFLDAFGDSAIAFDCIGSKLVRFDGLSSGSPKKSVLEQNVEVESIALSRDGSTATVVLKNDEIRKYDVSSGKHDVLTSIYPEMSLRLFALVQTVSWLYLIVVGIVLVVGAIRRALRTGRRDQLYRIVGSFVTAAIIVGFLVNNFVMFFSDSAEASSMQLAHASAIVGFTSPQTIGDVTKREVSALQSDDRDAELKENHAIRSFLEEFAASSYNNGVGMQSALFGVSQDGSHVWNLGETQRSTVSGSEVGDEELRKSVLEATKRASRYASYKDVNEISYAISADNPIEQNLHNSNKGYLFTCFVPIVASDGSCSAVLEVSQHFSSFWSQQMVRLLETILTVLLLTIGIYYASNEVVLSGGAVRRYGELRKEGVWWAGAVLSRPLTLLTTLATSIDAALAIVLARDMLKSQGLDSNVFMWGLPAFAITVGGLIGTIVYGHFSGRRPARSLALSMVLVGIAAQAVCAVAIGCDSFWIFVVGKLFAGIGYTAARCMVEALARQAKGEEKSVSVVGLYAKMPAGILGGVIGGILSSIGAIWIYVVAAAIGVALFLMLRYAMPADRPVYEMGKEREEKRLIDFVFGKKMILTMLLVMIPITLAGGYRKFLFPLLLDSSGMTKQDIANVCVIADVVIYMGYAKLREFRSAHDSWKLSWVSLLALGITFMLFSLNQSPLLAILVVVVASVILFFANAYKITARGWALEDYGYERFRTDVALGIENTAVKNVQAPVLSALQFLGGPLSCVILGVVFAICGVLYSITTRRYRPQKSEKAPVPKDESGAPA